VPRWLFVASLVTIAVATPVAIAQTPGVPGPVKFAGVSGTVLDEQDARPLNHVVVCFVLDRNGYTDSTSDYCDETDERGSFHVADLRAGRYSYRVGRAGYVAAEPLTENLSGVISLSAGDDLRDIKFRMQRAGVITGRVLYADGEPFSGAELKVHRGVSEEGRATTNDLGEFRVGNLLQGDYSVHIQSPSQTGDCGQFTNRRPRLYVPAPRSGELPSVHVASGQQATYPDLVMVQVTPHRVSGRVVWDSYPLPGFWSVSTGTRTIQARSSDGAFAICGLALGEYTIRTNALINGRTVAGELKVRIEDEDLKDVEITPEPSASIRARIEVEDNAPLDLAHTDILTIADSFPHGAVPQPRRQPDGSFVLDEVYTGEYRFFLAPLPSGSYLKYARLGGQDVLDAPLLVHGGESLDGLVFTVSPKAGTVTGIVQDETGSPIPNANVILQPDPRHTDRDIHGCLPTADQNGGFTCDSLAPGKYRVAAWRTFPLDFLQARDEVASKGTLLEVSESGRASIVLTVPK
jgi:Carboxypeptidase regulatory-like domain